MEPIRDGSDLDAVARSLTWSADLGGRSDGRPSVSRFGQAEVWLVRAGEQALILKRYRRNQSEDDVQWEHDFLDRLSATAFPVSRPVPALAGRSWLRRDDRVWGTLTYLPGRSQIGRASCRERV